MLYMIRNIRKKAIQYGETYSRCFIKNDLFEQLKTLVIGQKKENYINISGSNIEVDILLIENKDFEEEPVKDEEVAK